MKRFKDLEVGDVIVELGYNTEYTITHIDTHDNSSLISGRRRLYYNDGWSSFVVDEDRYCEDRGDFDNPRFITPKENSMEFQEVYKSGIRKGEMDFKCKVLNLFGID